MNEEWNCDKGRFAFRYLEHDSSVVDADGARGRAACGRRPGMRRFVAAAPGLRERDRALRLSPADASWSRMRMPISVFARRVLGTNNVDFRSRVARPRRRSSSSRLELQVGGIGPTYADLEVRAIVLLVAFEPEDESPIVLLRLRKAVRQRHQAS